MVRERELAQEDLEKQRSASEYRHLLRFLDVVETDKLEDDGRVKDYVKEVRKRGSELREILG